MKYFVLTCLFFIVVLTNAQVSKQRNRKKRTLVAPLLPVMATPKDTQDLPFRTAEDRTIDDNIIENTIENKTVDIELDEEDEDDSLQSRIVNSVNDFMKASAKENPGCVERFVCEAYRTGETIEGIPYLFMQLTNAAVSFIVADMFDQSININVLIRAARDGRQGNCQSSKTMQCDLLDNQLRTLGDYLGTFEEFLSQIFSSVSESLNFGR